MTLGDLMLAEGLRQWFGVSTYPARVLLLLYKARRPLSSAELAAGLDQARPDSIRVHVHALRSVVDLLRPSRGCIGRAFDEPRYHNPVYGLTERGRAQVAEAIDALPGELGEALELLPRATRKAA